MGGQPLRYTRRGGGRHRYEDRDARRCVCASGRAALATIKWLKAVLVNVGRSKAEAT